MSASREASDDARYVSTSVHVVMEKKSDAMATAWKIFGTTAW